MSGFMKTQGLYFNEFIKRKITDKKYSSPRPYVSQNLYCDLEKIDKLIEDYENKKSYVVVKEKTNLFKTR